MIYIDSLPILESQVGYGSLGLNGSLGYEGKFVTVRGKRSHHAISIHAPGRIRFQVDRRFASFTCQVAINDDVPSGASYADFVVTADGREVAMESYVRAGEHPRTLVADITGAEQLELVVRTSRWEYCHAVWLDPQVDESPAEITRLYDCLGRAEIIATKRSQHAERCIATVVSPGYEDLLDDMLGSLYANGECQDALLVVFVLAGNEACERIASKYQAIVIRGRPQSRLNLTSKSLLYSVARVVDANYFLCLDADMLILGSLRPIFSTMEACPADRILVCREGNSLENRNLGIALRTFYGGTDADIRRLGITPEEESYSLIVNDGLFAGSRSALLALDGTIRAIPEASAWTDGHRKIAWRNQFIFNFALARLQCGLEIDSTYNIQLHVQSVELSQVGARIQASWRGRKARVLHFSGGAKRKYPTWQGKFASQTQLVGQGDGDYYSMFLRALRTWIGQYGVQGLAWSFYGLSDGENAAVRDPSVMPLLATLHYLIRSNGCIRVLETGTARGISTACLASAVANRSGGRVVTMDPYTHSGRDELWATMPGQVQACIEPRQIDSLEGMTEALNAGERFDAALLDSIHTEERVLAEFQLATKLVCSGGLILIHDPIYVNGTVGGALRSIEQAGYNVVQLWTAESGIVEDDHLGLAIVENRTRQTAEDLQIVLAERIPESNSEG